MPKRKKRGTEHLGVIGDVRVGLTPVELAGEHNYDSLQRNYTDAKDKYESFPFGSEEGVAAKREMRDAAIELGDGTISRVSGTPYDPFRYVGVGPGIFSNKGALLHGLRVGAFRESPDANDVAGFFQSYASSPGFERIVSNQRKYADNVGRKYDEDAVREYQQRMRSVNGNGVFNIDMSIGDSFAGMGRSADKPVYIGTKEPSVYDTMTYGMMPYRFVLGHEFSHTIPYLKGVNRAIMDKNANVTHNSHDELPKEKHADIQGLKYLLLKEGIYDVRGNEDITEEQVQKLREKYPTMRPFRQMDNKQIMDGINTIVSVDNDRSLVNYSKLGGLIDRFCNKKIARVLASGGSIYIKPSHRGRLTELKARTGKTEAELYNDGNPAHKKMVVFARNSRKWKHSEGGLLSLPEDIEYANKWNRISNARYTMANDALVRSGSDKSSADRLARILAAQSALEAGWVDTVNGNNYAGYMSNGKRMSFDTPAAFWDYHINNLDQRWPDWRNAKTVGEYLDIINNTALGLDTKEKFDEYNRNHRDTPVYIYAPDWDNENYLGKLQGIYDKYVSKYVKPMFDAGGFMQRYGKDKILSAIAKMKQSK